MKLPNRIKEHIEKNCEILRGYSEKLAELYKNCYASTVNTALEPCEDGEIFVLTGDIPAMWLRDSSAQVNHYVQLCDDKEVDDIIRGVLKRQFRYILLDPYANAFNIEANGKGEVEDRPKNGPWVWEHKYETDSLCYPIKLLYDYYKKTEDRSLIEEYLPEVMRVILDLWKVEQYHEEKSTYRYFRPGQRGLKATLARDGVGTPVAYTGMVWAGFRPSDDRCVYHYNIPGNAFAVAVLGMAAEMLAGTSLAEECLALREEIEQGIRTYGVIEHPKYGKVFAYETDGRGNYFNMDDANVPSLISIPYLGYCAADDEIYQNTRRWMLSEENPFYYEGKYAKGIGSPHTPEGYIWHIALSMQGLTSIDKEEKLRILNYMIACDGGTGFMHEGFDANNPSVFTRDWFTWSDSLFAEFVESCLDVLQP